MNVAITFSAGAIEEGVKQSTVDIQAMLDKVAPALLPVLYTALMYYLIKKKRYYYLLVSIDHCCYRCCIKLLRNLSLIHKGSKFASFSFNETL